MSRGPSHPILVVDDDAEIQEVVQLVLSDEGYEVVAAPTGRTGLDLARERTPALILLDINLPQTDTGEFIRTYRDEADPSAPVIVFTAAAGAAERAKALGADGFLSKPFDVEQIVELVERFVG